MKNVILSLTFLLLAAGLSAQNKTDSNPAQNATEKLVHFYKLDASQQAEMLKVQERKYRNLAEIESLKTSDPQLYIQKVRALQYANDKSFERFFTEEQMALHHQQQRALREKKAVAYKELKSSGASQQEIDAKILALDLEALQ